eukprot:COSAG01_NODE_2536_length_7485_cov_13.683997_3_plen_257_part_00
MVTTTVTHPDGTVVSTVTQGRRKCARTGSSSGGSSTAPPSYTAALEKVLQVVGRAQLVPVIALDDDAAAVPLARALKEGGVHVMEITFRTDAAEASIRALSEAAIAGMCVGAGTVLTVEQAERAISAGAEFIISPGVDAEVVNYCVEHGVPVFPGVATPTDIQAALRCGVKVLKFFPAEAMGGVKTLKALAGPYRGVQFVPTGGINADNLSSYLAIPSVCACGGSWMVAKHLIAESRFDEITALCTAAVALTSGCA